jgi:hypothetical protein
MTAAFWPTQLTLLGIIPPTEVTQILVLDEKRKRRGRRTTTALQTTPISVIDASWRSDGDSPKQPTFVEMVPSRGLVVQE